MKIKKQIEKLHSLDAQKLRENLQKAEHQLFSARLDLRVGKMTDFSSIEKARKNVARIKTIINQKLRGAQALSL